MKGVILQLSGLYAASAPIYIILTVFGRLTSLTLLGDNAFVMFTCIL